jgi:uncharacterized protein YprB with RNaseH-like and TPR domain
LPDGEIIDTPHGSAYRIQKEYPADYRHGNRTLADLLEYPPELLAQVADQPALADSSVRDLVFLDTETTGLAGGAGTLVFLVGVGSFDGDSFRLRQFFLRDPFEEASMLWALQQDLESASGFVSFNGRAFDVPLLEMRYMIGLRRRWALTAWPQLDLLHPSRRLWRRILPNCTLNTIERLQLGIQRSEDDVPGSEIPGLYLDYLRTGDAGSMERVMYHNAVDILSLVGLSARVLDRYHQSDPRTLRGGEALAVARWHQSANRLEEAEAAFEAALETDNHEVQVAALRRYTSHLKRQGKHGQAIEPWIRWHQLQPEDPRPCVELAKYYEWRARDLPEAKRWTEEAMLALTHWPEDWRRDRAWKAVEHRLERLVHKLDAEAPHSPR